MVTPMRACGKGRRQKRNGGVLRRRRSEPLIEANWEGQGGRTISGPLFERKHWCKPKSLLLFMIMMETRPGHSDSRHRPGEIPSNFDKSLPILKNNSIFIWLWRIEKRRMGKAFRRTGAGATP
jgi:hypothetical protein